MSNRLRSKERCPIHGSYFCCGREKKKAFRKGEGFVNGVQVIQDERVPRGYREICTPAELRKRKDRAIRKQGGMCAICKEPLGDYRDVELDHKEPKGMGGGRRDDHEDNLQAAHKLCNRMKGSIRNF